MFNYKQSKLSFAFSKALIRLYNFHLLNYATLVGVSHLIYLNIFYQLINMGNLNKLFNMGNLNKLLNNRKELLILFNMIEISK